jgi:hypothetical protein
MGNSGFLLALAVAVSRLKIVPLVYYLFLKSLALPSLVFSFLSVALGLYLTSRRKHHFFSLVPVEFLLTIHTCPPSAT